MEFPGNSNRLTEKVIPDKKIEKVVSGEVVKRPKSLGRRFKDVFFGGEFKGVIRYVAGDVLLPALRDLIVDVSSKGVQRLIYGESAAARRRPTDYRARVMYNNPMTRTRDPRERERSYLPDQPPHSYRGSRHQVGELIIPSREEAETVLERLIDIIDKYDLASVADLYDLVGLPSSYVDNKWGWSLLTNVEIRQVREGYIIDLPQVEPI